MEDVGAQRSPNSYSARNKVLAQKLLPWKPGEETTDYKPGRHHLIEGEHYIATSHFLLPGLQINLVTWPPGECNEAALYADRSSYNLATTTDWYEKLISTKKLLSLGHVFSFFLSFYISFHFISAKGRRRILVHTAPLRSGILISCDVLYRFVWHESHDTILHTFPSNRAPHHIKVCSFSALW